MHGELRLIPSQACLSHSSSVSYGIIEAFDRARQVLPFCDAWVGVANATPFLGPGEYGTPDITFIWSCRAGECPPLFHSGDREFESHQDYFLIMEELCQSILSAID